MVQEGRGARLFVCRGPGAIGVLCRFGGMINPAQQRGRCSSSFGNILSGGMIRGMIMSMIVILSHRHVLTIETGHPDIVPWRFGLL